jgi:hypothetical protein
MKLLIALLAFAALAVVIAIWYGDRLLRRDAELLRALDEPGGGWQS